MPGSLWPLLIWGEGMTPVQLQVIKGLCPGLVQISRGLNLMHFERSCMEDKASHLASPSKDFYSLINTNSAILAPLEILLRGRLVPWGTSLMVNRISVLAGSGHGSLLSSIIESPEATLPVLPLGPIFCSLHRGTVSAYMTVTLLKIWVMFPGKLLVICTELRRQSQTATNRCSPEERRRAKAINSWLTPAAAAPGAEHLYSYPDTACGKPQVNPLLQSLR